MHHRVIHLHQHLPTSRYISGGRGGEKKWGVGGTHILHLPFFKVTIYDIRRQDESLYEVNRQRRTGVQRHSA